MSPYTETLDLGAVLGGPVEMREAGRGSQVVLFTPRPLQLSAALCSVKLTVQERSFTRPKIDTLNDVLIAS